MSEAAIKEKITATMMASRRCSQQAKVVSLACFCISGYFLAADSGMLPIHFSIFWTKSNDYTLSCMKFVTIYPPTILPACNQKVYKPTPPATTSTLLSATHRNCSCVFQIAVVI